MQYKLNRLKFIIGGLIILIAVAYLIYSSSSASAAYFMTVEELQAQEDDAIGKNLRISGAVIGESIRYDPQAMDLSFEIAQVPGDNEDIEAQGGLALVLHHAVTDPTQARLQVVYNGVKPDLLRDEAQAIITGTLGTDGIFHADELLLKCPTKYEDTLPGQVGNE